MEGTDFLIIDDQPIYLRQAMSYLQASGKMGEFIGEIMRQYIIERELLTRTDIAVNPVLVEQSVIDFRLKNQLADPNQFQEWLSRNGGDYASFHQQKGVLVEKGTHVNLVEQKGLYWSLYQRQQTSI